jgi:DNA-binding transcriptional MerR regulator
MRIDFECTRRRRSVSVETTDGLNMKIGELARRCGLSVHTLRYYESIGLLPKADKNASGHRDYDASILTWIEFLGRLKTTGMPIQTMLLYAQLRAEGPSTGKARQRLLEEHRDKVRTHLADLSSCLSVLDTKIEGYALIDDMENDNGCSQSRRNPLRKGPGSARPH